MENNNKDNKNKEGNNQKDHQLTDKYDVMKYISSVEKKVDALKGFLEEHEITKDYILANLSDTIFENRTMIYIRDRLEIIEIMDQTFIQTEYDIAKRADGKEIDKEKMQIRTKLEIAKCKEILLKEIRTTVLLSRAVDGITLKAFLKAIGPEGQTEVEMVPKEEKTGIFGQKKKEEVK